MTNVYAIDGITAKVNACVTVDNYRDDMTTLNKKLDELMVKPEVRLDQRTSLDTTGRSICVNYYDKGRKVNSKTLMSNIRVVEIYNDNTIKLTFDNGDVQTATAQEGDEFSFEVGAMICLMKELLGKESSQILGKLIDYTAKIYNDAEKQKARKALEEAEKADIKQRQKARQKKRWAKKLAKARENRIQEMAEAIVKANGLLKIKK